MYRSRNVRIVALVLTLALVGAACSGRSSSKGSTSGGGSGTSGGGSGSQAAPDTSKCTSANDTTGISGDTITLGSSYPQSGNYAAFSSIFKGAKAYFDGVNASGGVPIAGKKYKIKIVDKDDNYEAGKTSTNVQSLVNDSKVFGLFSVVGTPNNLAVRTFLDKACVPEMFAASGSPTMGDEKYPWMMGSSLTPYSDEVRAFVDYLKANKPNAKVAILAANDDFGQAYVKTFNQLIKGTSITVTQTQTYNSGDPSVDTQVTSLANTKSDALLLGATALACPQALKAVRQNNWKPIIYVSGTCAAHILLVVAGADADGIISTVNIMDPLNPMYDTNPAMVTYKKQLTTSFGKDADMKDGVIAYGYTQAALLVEAMKRATAATRSAVMTAVLNEKDIKNVGLLMDGITLNSGKGDKFLGEEFQLEQYDFSKGYFHYIGGLTKYDGETAKNTPADVLSGS